MKNWIEQNWITLMVGFTTGMVFMQILNIIENVLTKIAIIVNG